MTGVPENAIKVRKSSEGKVYNTEKAYGGLATIFVEARPGVLINNATVTNNPYSFAFQSTSTDKTRISTNRHYGPFPSDVLPQLVAPSESESESSLTNRRKQRRLSEDDVGSIESYVPRTDQNTPGHVQVAFPITSSGYQLSINQRHFRKLITGGEKRALECYQAETPKSRVSIFTHKLYLPSVPYSYSPPPLSPSPQKPDYERPLYDILVLLSISPDIPHPFSCRSIPYPKRKLKRFNNADPRLNRLAIKLLFKDDDHALSGQWTTAGDPLLVRLLELYDSFQPGAEKEEIDYLCLKYYDKYVVQNEKLTW
ncbi:hypothetical protein Clacol_007841 [Clathrus columnatus]|uniref:Uncharacterized protein n=1 Tax=Clathrus columnatus TaxID=1419009 RepID=A0AAV5ANU0_9AGAM|nr:hypothetical protein Clacol_007841 [Clathrus columnatus]